VNCGAGPLAEPAPEAGSARTSEAVNGARIAATPRFMASPSCPSEKYGRTQARFHIVGELRHAQQVRPEHAILYLDVNREPVRGQPLEPAAKVPREAVVVRKLGGTNPADKIERARQGATATDKGLAREQVVAQGDVVVREASPSAVKQ